ncbi:Aldo/keto reductase [Trametes versicolor FP-101664 SS1]|uniref:Aldo/keto reductase n=1 Tax=Trametes versicolor (strain FP-101664) TaxID=717944 RepID=UPI0004624294|nr:Aldo/keto reductase [Trametes versicolor FP-101664 SS1]EIW62146.1 Aldo/keto reductase [Trametes versicolor FP-101664 SS1]
MTVPLGSPQPVFALPPLDAISDVEEDKPVDGLPLSKIGPMGLPEIVFGAATFSNTYNSDSTIASDIPVRTTRLALRYGIDAFDTSPYYGPSEIILGTALKVLELEFPRSSYKLASLSRQSMTKCGRYGSTQAEFDYTPATIRASVKRSLERLHTTYLDTVYLHDVEFVCTPVGPRSGHHAAALADAAAEYGLAPGQGGTVWGAGDQAILDAVAELRKLQAEGVVKHVGISGYPLPTLLRLALLVLHATGKPLDVLLSYSHSNLQNATVAAFAPHFRARAQIPQLLTASPLNMGLLTPRYPPWHPASPELREAAAKAREACEEALWDGGLPNVAVGYGFRKGAEVEVPVVVGLSNLAEVHESVRAWRGVKAGTDEAKRVALEQRVVDIFGEHAGWSWASP